MSCCGSVGLGVAKKVGLTVCWSGLRGWLRNAMLLEILFVGQVEACRTEDGECRACWLKGIGPSGCG